MQKIYKIGVIGLGDISTVYLNNLRKYPQYVELYACACRSLEKAEQKAKQFGFKKAYASGDALLADPEVDVVMNLTTPAMHYPYNIEALRRGKHVYSEKPFAATFQEAKEVLDLAKEKGLYCGCAPDTFMGGRIQAMKRFMDEGELGQVVGGSAFMLCKGWEWFHPSPDFYYQPGGGPLLDMGPYYLHCLLSLLGPVDSVCAMATRGQEIRQIVSGPRKGEQIQVDPTVDTHIVSNLRFRNGALVTLNVSFDVWDSTLPRLELYGSKGTLAMAEPDPCDGPNIYGGQLWFRGQAESRWLHMPRREEDLQSDWRQIPVEGPFNQTGQAENSRGIGLVDMVQAFEEGRPNRASGDMATHALEVMEGILTSAKEKRFVEMKTDFQVPEAFRGF